MPQYRVVVEVTETFVVVVDAPSPKVAKSLVEGERLQSDSGLREHYTDTPVVYFHAAEVPEAQTGAADIAFDLELDDADEIVRHFTTN